MKRVLPHVWDDVRAVVFVAVIMVAIFGLVLALGGVHARLEPAQAVTGQDDLVARLREAARQSGNVLFAGAALEIERLRAELAAQAQRDAQVTAKCASDAWYAARVVEAIRRTGGADGDVVNPDSYILRLAHDREAARRLNP